MSELFAVNTQTLQMSNWILGWKEIHCSVPFKNQGQTLHFSQCLHTQTEAHTCLQNLPVTKLGGISFSGLKTLQFIPSASPRTRRQESQDWTEQRILSFCMFCASWQKAETSRENGAMKHSSPKILSRLQLNHIVIPSSVSHLSKGLRVLLLFFPFYMLHGYNFDQELRWKM